MIRICILSLIFFISTTGCQESDDAYKFKVEREITDLLEEQRKAWNNGDLETFVSYYLPGQDLRFTTSSGILKGSEELQKRYEMAYPDKDRRGMLDFQIHELRVLNPDYAVAIGKWTLERDGDRPSGYFTLIWERTPEGWKIAIDHTS